MIRSNELSLFLQTILDTVMNDLMPQLGSSSARKSADQLIQILARLTAQIRDGDRLAAEQLGRWRDLRAEFASLSGTALQAAADSRGGEGERLELELEAMQASLLAETSLPSLARAFEKPGSAASAWYRRAVEASFAQWESNEASVIPPQPKATGSPGGEDLELLRHKLNRYLVERYPQLPADAVSTLRVSAGGMTKLTALFSLPPNSALPRELVLRRDTAVNMTGTVVADEFPIIERLFKLGLAVPRPILVETDPAILGGAFMIMTAVDAEPAGTYFAKDRALSPTLIGPQFGRDAAGQLARLHRLTESKASDPALSAARQQEVEAAYRRWKAGPKPPNSVIVDLGFAWLRNHPLSKDRPRCLIHGDYGVHNMMARQGRLAAVLDWELAVEDDPAIDLAECRMMMVEDTLPWDEFVAAYCAAGGDAKACDPAALTYYCVWTYTVKFGLMLSDARNAFVSGLRADSLMASAASQSMDRILQHLARAMQMTL
jgi:aminoglycoside phosphotransferase (APT) family kinase protein